MDKFFQELRKIQKKERANSSLAKVDNNFYSLIYSYINELKDNISDDPFSNESYLLKDTQRIATEICERREHKIAEAALMNIHRSYHLFKGKPKFDLVDTTPLNLTDEEEKLYYSLMDSFKVHRNNISLDNLNNQKDEESNTVYDKDIDTEDSLDEDNQVTARLSQIANAKIIKDEKREPIEKQIIDSNIDNLKKEPINSFKESNKNSNVDNLKEESVDKDIKSDISKEDNSELDNIRKAVNNQFIDLKEEDFLDSKLKNKSLEENVLVLIFKDFNEIIGIDEKVYGPFKSQDLVILPKANANVIVRCRKGRLVKI
ncbi:DNA replication complex subunit Gins51 [Methanobrevibacter wolinii]|uniref:DNA replication complex subunit Gins51 n=1 Tax=Methanobrevibacter wolinii TaxID=190977 RepID=UPI0005B2E63B|nr:hypothetical protein [Methanobrevibacter wolinii]MDD5960241.1 hypothetical protein [Methanobrevibacter wolinii]